MNIDDVIQRDEAHDGKEHEHQRVGDHHSARSRVEREQRVARPGYEEPLQVSQRCQLRQEDRAALCDSQQVTTQAQDDRHAGRGLNLPAVEALSKELGNGQGATSP